MMDHQQQTQGKNEQETVGGFSKCMDTICGWVPPKAARITLMILSWVFLASTVYFGIVMYYIDMISTLVKLSGNIGTTSYVHMFAVHLIHMAAASLSCVCGLALSQVAWCKRITFGQKTQFVFVGAILLSIVLVVADDVGFGNRASWTLLPLFFFSPTAISGNESSVILFFRGSIIVANKPLFIVQEILVGLALVAMLFCGWSTHRDDRINNRSLEQDNKTGSMAVSTSYSNYGTTPSQQQPQMVQQPQEGVQQPTQEP